jgi:hypothetical protein
MQVLCKMQFISQITFYALFLIISILVWVKIMAAALAVRLWYIVVLLWRRRYVFRDSNDG